ncbi:MAG: hydrogenase 2 operon protein HybA [Anaerolineales bacterium]|nr:hydrogenase 2 operon protein HybA [Anaerolineales bacterium]
MSTSRRTFLKYAGLGVGSVLALPANAFASGGNDAGDDVAMLYDATLCVGCRACQNACRDWNNTQDEKDKYGLYDAPQELSENTWTLIQLYEGDGEYSFVKHQCMHCLEPACASACPVGALKKQENGAVVYNADICIGCRYCMVACPFGVPKAEWKETLPEIKKCTFCADRLRHGDGPNCVEACPTGALIWGTRDELLAEAHRRIDENPDLYQETVYGEHDGGGTSALYLSHVTYGKLGFPELGDSPVPQLSESLAVYGTPSILGVVAISLAVINRMNKKKVE